MTRLRREITEILQTHSRYSKLGGLGGYLPRSTFWTDEILDRINEKRWFFNKVSLEKIITELAGMESQGLIKKMQPLFWHPGNYSVEAKDAQ